MDIENKKSDNLDLSKVDPTRIVLLRSTSTMSYQYRYEYAYLLSPIVSGSSIIKYLVYLRGRVEDVSSDRIFLPKENPVKELLVQLNKITPDPKP